MADCTGLENRHVREGIVSSNLTLSAFSRLKSQKKQNHSFPDGQPKPGCNNNAAFGEFAHRGYTVSQGINPADCFDRHRR